MEDITPGYTSDGKKPHFKNKSGQKKAYQPQDDPIYSYQNAYQVCTTETSVNPSAFDSRTSVNRSSVKVEDQKVTSSHTPARST